MSRLSIAAVAGFALIAGMTVSVQASILPGSPNQKWEVNLDGFAALVDSAGAPLAAVPGDSDSVLLRSLTKISSQFKSQGDIALEPGSPPSKFKTGLDPTGGKVADQSFIGVLGMMITGMRIIAVDDRTAAGGFVARYSLGDAGFGAAIAALSSTDIVYFGDDPGDSTSPMGLLYHDPSAANANFAPGTGFWNAAGDYYDNPGATPDLGGGDDLVLKLSFQDLGGYQVDGLNRSAPAGTLVANVLTDDGGVRPVVVTDVIGGSGASSVVDGGMKTTLFKDSNSDGFIDGLDSGSTTFVGDLIAGLGASPILDDEGNPTGYTTLSDPAEWVSTPEAGSVVVWGVLGLIGVVGWRRRSR